MCAHTHKHKEKKTWRGQPIVWWVQPHKSVVWPPCIAFELRNQQARNTQLPQGHWLNSVLTAEMVPSIYLSTCPSGHSSALCLYCLHSLRSHHLLSSTRPCSSAELSSWDLALSRPLAAAPQQDLFLTHQGFCIFVSFPILPPLRPLRILQ